MFPLFAPKFNKFSADRDDESITTLHDSLPIATTLIFIFSEKGESHAPRRASIINKSSLYLMLENLVRFVESKRFIAKYVVAYCEGSLMLMFA